MSTSWYYVLEGERQGPVEAQQIKQLMGNGVLGDKDYVWKKGLDNWVTIEKCKDFQGPTLPTASQSEGMGELPKPLATHEALDLAQRDENLKDLFIKTGADRGGQEAEYGPFSLNILKKIYEEKRINGKTFIFHKSLKNWMPLSDVKGFEEVFHETPPPIEDTDRRAFKRKPLIARIFIQQENQVFEGICRDLSVGGMQVLLDGFPGDVGQKISINVHPDNSEHHFVASGEIVRILEGKQGFSFRFINLNSEALDAIRSYIG